MIRSDERRLILAFAIAIALHETIAALIPAGLSPKPSAREVVANARLVQISIVPKPSPPARHVAVRVRTLTLRLPQRSAPSGGATAHSVVDTHPRAAHLVARAAVPAEAAASENVAPGPDPVGGQGSGTQIGTGAGETGTGDGAAAGDEPCGFVSFSDPHGSQYDPRTRGFWVDIRMSVHFADGSSQSMILDYPWFYPSEAANPWSDQNLHDPNFPTRFQAPPPAKLANEPALVHYVIAHSTAEGLTLLKDCPTTSPSPST